MARPKDKVPPSAPVGSRAGKRPRGHAQAGAPQGGRGRKRAPTRVRTAGAKVNDAAARALRAGHPWVFRDSLLREPQGADRGKIMPLQDPDGYPLGHGIYEPEGAVALRVLSRDESFTWTEEVIADRVKRALAYRDAHLESGVETACRLVHAEADGLPGLAVDRLGEYLLIYKYAKVAQTFLDPVADALEAAVNPRGIYLQDRVRPVTPDEPRPPATLLRGKAAPPEFEVVEDGLKFVVDVTAPVSPGLFLDLREGRRLVERIARDRTVLNLFSFTGSLSIRALRGGAKSVANVDAAAKAHARCRQNLQLNGMDPEACEALNGDVFKHLERMRARDRKFDLVIVDPPPFSRVNSTVFSALRDWGELMSAVSAVVAPDGLVLAVSNAGKLDPRDFMAALGEGAAARGRAARLIGGDTLPRDFPVPPAYDEGRYLQVTLLHLP